MEGELDEREAMAHLRRLEDALVEYVERYGLTDKAREALSSSAALRARDALEAPSEDAGE